MPTDRTQPVIQFLEHELNNGYHSPQILAIEVTRGRLRDDKERQLRRATKILRKEILRPLLPSWNLSGIEKIVIGFGMPRRALRQRKDCLYLVGDHAKFCKAYTKATGLEIWTGPFYLETCLGIILNKELQCAGEEFGYAEESCGRAISHVLYTGIKVCEFDVISVANADVLAKIPERLESRYSLNPLEA